MNDTGAVIWFRCSKGLVRLDNLLLIGRLKSGNQLHYVARAIIPHGILSNQQVYSIHNRIGSLKGQKIDSKVCSGGMVGKAQRNAMNGISTKDY